MSTAARCVSAMLLVAVAWLTAPLDARQRPQRPLDAALATITPGVIRAHATFLADPLLRGRALGTEGGQLAARYVAAQFAAIGLEPAGDEGFFQDVALVGVTPQASLVLGAGRHTLALQQSRDFVAWTERADPTVTADGELVFNGFGSRGPRQVSAFDGAQVMGKILLMLVGDGAGADAAMAGEVALADARRSGATGVLLVPMGQGAPDWPAIQASWDGERLVAASASPAALRFAAWVVPSTVRRFLDAAGVDLDVLIHRAQRDDFRPIALSANAAVYVRNSVRHIHAANVVGRLAGADPERRGETVLVSTAYDGRPSAKAPDSSVAPGDAIESAARAAVLVAVAAAFVETEPRPPRSVMFLASVDGRDGVGARSFVRQTSVPLQQIVAVLDLGRAGVGDSVEPAALGAELSTLGGEWLRAAADERLRPNGGVNRARPPLPERALTFARTGIPTLSVGDVTPAGRQSGDSFDGAAAQARLLVRLANALAVARTFPSWTEGSEFLPAGQRLMRLREGT